MELYNLARGSKKAILAGLLGSADDFPSENGFFDMAESMEELKRLAQTLELDPLETVTQERQSPDPRTYFGKGKVEEMAQMVKELGADLVLVNGSLSPAQARALEDALGVPVMDRTKVILEIFAKRAKTREGKLQVELASLRYELPRLLGHGKEMSNQGGGIGTRGPGEKKLEEDRRVLRENISRIQAKLARMSVVREGTRKTRKKSGMPRISLVGYTNVGKSTLFKALTGDEGVLCDDRLFATLDPWVRRWRLPGGQIALLSDTVGFIQGLPHELVASFRSTLEESLDADIIIHVVDLSSRVFWGEISVVENVLRDLGASSIPRITCFNKIDKVSNVDIETILARYSPSCAISAICGLGLDRLGETALSLINQEKTVVSFLVPYSQWDIIYEIRSVGTVISEIHRQDGALVTCRLSEKDKTRFETRLAAEMRR